MKAAEREWLFRRASSAIERLTMGADSSAAELRATAALLRTLATFARTDAQALEEELRPVVTAPRVAVGGG